MSERKYERLVYQFTPQYKQAADLVVGLANTYGSKVLNADTVMTGHSLGGGLT